MVVQRHNFRKGAYWEGASMAELDKTISVIESWLKQPVLTPPPINELYDALELLKEQDEEVKAAYRRGLESGRTIKWD